MSNPDDLIRQALTKKPYRQKAKKTAQCIDSRLLLDYAARNLDEPEAAIIEGHIANCGFCLSELNIIFEALASGNQEGFEPVPRELIAAARKTLDGRLAPARQRKPPRITKGRLFLGGTILFFAASFLVPRYFMQFLVAALILGIRWAFESESGRALIMVVDSWRKHSHDDDDEISRRLKGRSNRLPR